MNRIYHNYNLWECYRWGMYDKKCFMDEHQIINENYQTLCCGELLYETMTFVSHHWYFSMQHHLTNTHRNRQAHLGQSACSMINGSPEYLTKLAWNKLTFYQQKMANDIADDVIIDWESKHTTGYFE